MQNGSILAPESDQKLILTSEGDSLENEHSFFNKLAELLRFGGRSWEQNRSKNEIKKERHIGINFVIGSGGFREPSWEAKCRLHGTQNVP